MERRKDHIPPANWQDFEDLCLKLWRPKLIDAKKNGRSGQPQAGVDIFGRDPKTEEWVGIQCKQRGQWPPKVLTLQQIKEEVRKAAKFKPPLSQFIIATTAQRDAKSQEFVRRLGYWRDKAGNFSVDLFAWDDLQDWLQEEPEPISREKAFWVWRQRILRLHSHLMPYFQRRGAPPLEHVYVEVQLDPGGQAERFEEQLAQEGLLGRPLSIREVLDVDPARHPWVTRRWLLRGDPGSGKTTLLRHLASTLAEAGGGRWVPVFESLPQLMLEAGWFMDRLEANLRRGGHPGAEIRKALEEHGHKGRLLLLLDGLDEVPREHRKTAQTLLRDLATRWPESPLVVTTRPIGAWSPGKQFLELELLPFDAERRRLFLSSWLGPEDHSSTSKAEMLATKLEASLNLRELASNPLYLTLIVLLVEEGHEPAEHRAQLYDQIFDLVEEGRHHDPPTPMDNRIVAHQGLCRLAYEMTKENLDAEPVQQLERRLYEDKEIREPLKETWPSLRTYLDDVAEKTGILGPHDGPEADWRFWHRTFREALTAEQLADVYVAGGREAILQHARELKGDLSRWAEPYALLAGKIEDPDTLVQALVQENRDLGLRALATAQSVRDETVEEILKLSQRWQERVHVYKQIPRLIDDPIRVLAFLDRLRRRTRSGNDLFFLEQTVVTVLENWPDGRRQVEKLLSCFYDHIPPPPEEMFRRIFGQASLWRKIPARELHGSFQMAAVPVTVAQYGAFEPEHHVYHRHFVPAEGLEHHPVESVSWYQAFTFCRWLSASLQWARGARLPTKEEWEYVCHERYGEIGLSTRQVGQGGANKWGLYDLGENVWEWTLSVDGSNYLRRKRSEYLGPSGGIKLSPFSVEIIEASEAGNARRFICGSGNFGSRTDAHNCSTRPQSTRRNLGFRVCIPTAPDSAS